MRRRAQDAWAWAAKAAAASTGGGARSGVPADPFMGRFPHEMVKPQDLLVRAGSEGQLDLKCGPAPGPAATPATLA